jgi:hypothetical protein
VPRPDRHPEVGGISIEPSGPTPSPTTAGGPIAPSASPHRWPSLGSGPGPGQHARCSPAGPARWTHPRVLRRRRVIESGFPTPTGTNVWITEHARRRAPKPSYGGDLCCGPNRGLKEGPSATVNGHAR